MAKFCKKCGFMANDTDMVCTQCGTPLETPQKDAADKLFQKIAMVIGLIVCIVIVANIIGANTGYKGTVKKVIKNFEAGKTEKLVGMASRLGEELCETWGITDYDEYCEEQIENAKDRIEDEVGTIKKISYEIYSAEKMDKDRYKEAENYFDSYDVRFSADKVYMVGIKLTIKGSKGTNDFYTNLLVMKENGDWKVYNGGY